VLCFRYIAIVHPIHAHIICCRRRILAVLTVIWPLSLLCGLPTLLYNTLRSPPSQPGAAIQLCVLVFAGPRSAVWATVFKVSEFALFFLFPVVVQICLYVIIGRKLFVGSKDLHRRQQVISIITIRKRKTDKKTVCHTTLSLSCTIIRILEKE